MGPRIELTRREFFGLTIATLFELKGISCVNPSPKQTETTKIQPQDKFRYFENQNALDLKEVIEKEFSIELTTQAAEEEKTFGRLVDNHPDLIAKWTSRALNLLREDLSLLPNYFIEPQNQGKKMRIILTPWQHSATCDCFPSMDGEDVQNDLNLGYQVLTPEYKKGSFVAIVHELVHKVTPKRLKKDIDKKKPLIAQLDSEWFSIIDNILGENFSIARTRLYEKVLEINPEINKRPRQELDKSEVWTQEDARDYFLSNVIYSLGKETEFEDKTEKADLPFEFISVLGQHYVMGKDFFIKMYGLILPMEKVNLLYEFVKNDIFKGKEYYKLPIE